MSDWQVGDLALCVGSHPLYPPEVQPGKIHTVEWIWTTEDCTNPDHVDLAFDLIGVPRAPGDLVYWHRNFIKVTPPAADEFDREVIELMNRKPVEA